MSKYTTTLNEYINSELMRQGKNEFINNGHLSFFDDKYAFIQKILYYDDDVADIVTYQIFKGFQFTDKNVDKLFKQTFVTRFLDREISRQTIEAFASQVLSITIQHQEYIISVFSELDKFANGESSGNENSNSDRTTIDEHREAKSTLPQNEVNINVDHDELDFADENRITKDKHTDNYNESSSYTRNTYNPDNLEKIFDMKERLMDKFDKKCFMQIW